MDVSCFRGWATERSFLIRDSLHYLLNPACFTDDYPSETIYGLKGNYLRQYSGYRPRGLVLTPTATRAQLYGAWRRDGKRVAPFNE